MDDRRRIASEKWRKANPDKVKAAARARYWRNREKFIAAGAKWRSENREKSRIAARRWQDNNLKKFKEDHAKWRRLNAAKRCAKQALRKASKRMASPIWANQFFIAEAYDLANRRSKLFSFKWHVDHIVPLQSKIVCGLHAHTNLRVIPGSENISKHNKYWPDMP